jgi:hypothetical protein
MIVATLKGVSRNQNGPNSLRQHESSLSNSLTIGPLAIVPVRELAAILRYSG